MTTRAMSSGLPSGGPAPTDGSDGSGMLLFDFSQSVALIYQGPLESPPWSRILCWLNEHFRSSWSALVLRPASQAQPALMIEAHGCSARLATAEYTLHYEYVKDVFSGLPPDIVTTPEDAVDPHLWRRSEHFQRYLRPLDIHYLMGADFYVDDVVCRLRLCRPRSSGPFTAEDRALCQLFLPHFKIAVQQHAYLYRVEVERTLYAGTLDHLQLGVIVLDAAGEVLTVSPIAAQLLAAREALCLRGNTVHACFEQADTRLRRLMRQVRERATEGAAVSEAMAVALSEGGSLGLLIRTIPSAARVEGSRRPALAIFIRDPRRQAIPSADRLRALFDMTPAETALAVLLAEGLTLEQAGENLHISRNTIKSRLRSIFAKTGTSRQPALVRVLLETLGTL